MIQKAFTQAAIIFSLLVLLAPPPSVMGGEAENEQAEELAEEGRNELGVFLGVTVTEDESGFSVGLDYEYRISRLFGIGAVLEYTGMDFREWLVGIPFYLHPWKELKLLAAPGFELEKDSGEKEFVVRLGGEYGIGLGGGYEIAPALNIDITREDTAFVIGATLSKSF